MPTGSDGIVKSIGLLAELMRFFQISHGDAVRLAMNPDDHEWLEIDSDLTVAVTRATFDIGAGLTGLVEYKHKGEPRLVHALPIPDRFSVEQSPLGAFRALCNECGVTMRIGDKVARLMIRQHFRGPHLTREHFLGDVTKARHTSHLAYFNRLDNGWVVGFAYGIRWEHIKSLL